MNSALLEVRERRELLRQRAVSRILSPLWLFALTGVMRFVMRWRIEDHRTLRREFARLRAQSDAPLLICANHLTMVDSFVIGWALGGPGYYLRDFGGMAWNIPERRNFADSLWKRVLTYVLKCVPVTRGADRREVAHVLSKVAFLMSIGEVAMVFPEGGRSRSGRVDRENAAYGVGRLVGNLPGCRVLCVYLRGERQESWSDMPQRGQCFRVLLSHLEPKSDKRGLRASLEIAKQVVGRIADLEEDYFAGRK